MHLSRELVDSMDPLLTSEPILGFQCLIRSVLRLLSNG